ncbi:sulfatase-like hydrolase/transferase [Paracoccus mangrovi]|uniref:Sulfatase-like hydrolase/transferase n=1 Tax=Paracoccus mangrovi TaxID=1715645 RepID=A0ABV7R2L0_9RHOB
MRKPNVIVFFTDQQRHDTTGAHGNPMGLTPNFDRLARAGTHLYNSFACQPLCGPARAALQTGRYATQTGVFRNEITLPPDQPTLAQVFKAGGYATGYIGKWHLAAQDPVPPDLRGGYDYWLAANHLEFVSDAYDARLFDGDGNEQKLPGYRVDAQTDAAIRYIDRHRDTPFLLFMSFLEPHHQNHTDDYPPPEGYRQTMDANLWTPPDLVALGGTSPWHLAGYYGMVKRLDEAFGRMMDALRSLDLTENTIVMFTSDHACHFKTRNAEYKRSCHESAVRVPTMITGPGFMGGGQVTAMFSTPDIAPTLIEAAGLQVPASMTGASILPVIRDARAPWRDDSFFQVSESETGRAIRTKRWKYGVTADYDHDRPGAPSYREVYLYDLDADPYEMVNLAGMAAFRETADMLKARLLDWIARIEGETPEITDAPPTFQRQHRPHYSDLRREYQADTSMGMNPGD